MFHIHPSFDRGFGHVPHLDAVSQLADRNLVNELLYQGLGGDDPGPGRGGRLGKRSDPVLTRVARQQNVKESAVSAGSITLRRHERHHVAIEVVDAGDTRRQCVAETDRDRNVAGERNAQLVGSRRNRGEFFIVEARVNLDEIVSCRMLLSDLTFPVRCTADRAPVQRRAGRNQPGPERAAREQVLAKLQVRGMTQHATHGGYAVRDEQRKVSFKFAGPNRRHVGVHLGEPRQEEPVSAVYDPGIFGDGHLVDVADRADDSVTHDDRLPGDDSLVGHRQHVYVHEYCNVGGRGGSRDEGHEK